MDVAEIEYDDLSSGRLLTPGEKGLIPHIGDHVSVKFPDRDEIFVAGTVVDVITTTTAYGKRFARVVVDPSTT